MSDERDISFDDEEEARSRFNNSNRMDEDYVLDEVTSSRMLWLSNATDLLIEHGSEDLLEKEVRSLSLDRNAAKGVLEMFQRRILPTKTSRGRNSLLESEKLLVEKMTSALNSDESDQVNINLSEEEVFLIAGRTYDHLSGDLERGMRLTPDSDTFSFLDLNEAFVKAGGRDVKSYRLALEYMRTQLEAQ